MEYLFLLYADPQRLGNAAPEQMSKAMAEHRAIREEATARGAFRGANRLTPAREGFTIRSRQDGSTLSTDGPYAETREMMGGYYLIECADASEARAWAERLAHTGNITAVEVRCVQNP